MNSRTPVGEHGASWVRPVTSGAAEQWLATVWVRDLDGRRRLVEARRPGRQQHEQQPVFAHVGGGWLWPNNVRTKLRGVVAGTPLVGVSPHTLRRTVGTLVAYSAGLDAARDVLGHRDPSVTARHYIADTGRVIDVRGTLEPLFA